jgi:hypothetical protein
MRRPYPDTTPLSNAWQAYEYQGNEEITRETQMKIKNNTAVSLISIDNVLQRHTLTAKFRLDPGN